MLSYCDLLMSGVHCPSPTIASKDISKTTGWIKTKLARNDPYIALFNNFSKCSSPLHI